ncbi:MAG: hypothetical protein KDC04_00890 [Saprospiraceae bacterium]|nr:hypothetical protein [Saprospiraceae bacterium]
MKFFLSFGWAMMISGFALFLASCGTDTSLTNGPTVSFAVGTDVLSSDATVAAGQEFSIQVVAQAGDAQLSTITIKDNGSNVTVDRLTFEGLSGAANPLSLTGADKTSFNRKVTIVAHTEAFAHTYSVVITDEDGQSASKNISISTEATPPTVTLNATTTFDIGVDSWFSLNIDAQKGTADLDKVEVLINGATATDLSRLAIVDLTNVFTANPNTLPATAKESFSGKIFVKSPSTSGTYIYTFKFIDTAGKSDSKDLVVSVGQPVATILGALFNQAGPSGTGGLDLDTGASLGSTNANVEVRDMGIDNALPIANNWRQKIAGVNGTEIRYVKAGQNGVSENFKFDDVLFKEQIATLYGSGVAFTGTLNSLSVSDKVNKGDIFVAKKGSDYYIFVIKDIVLTAADNNDKYEVDIKK